MSDPNGLERFLTTDPVDPGCAKALEMLDAYVDMLLAGGAPAEKFPDIAAHLYFAMVVRDNDSTGPDMLGWHRGTSSEDAGCGSTHASQELFAGNLVIHDGS